MNYRQNELIKVLLYSSAPKTANSLLDLFQISERTLKYDLSAIRKETKKYNINLLNKKGVGYYFLPADKPRLIEKFSFIENFDLAEYHHLNFSLFMLWRSQSVPLIELADFFYYEPVSIKRIIDDIDTALKPSLEISDGQLTMMKESENDLRLIYTELIIREIRKVETGDFRLRLEKALPMFAAKHDRGWLNRMELEVKRQIHLRSMWLSQNALEYLLVYLYVTKLRINQGLSIENQLPEQREWFVEEYKFASELFNNLNWWNAEQAEIDAIVHVMIEQNILCDSHLSETMEMQLDHTLQQLAQMLNEIRPNEFSISELIKDLVPHLKQILRKKKVNSRVEPNPLFHQIKVNYNSYYKLGQQIYRYFSKSFAIDYSDDEASLIAIYLYKNSMNHRDSIFSAYLVCGTGRGFAKLLETRLHNLFPNIEIVDRLSSYQLLKKQSLTEVDLIISTIDLPVAEVPVVKISSFLSRRDIQLISQTLEYGTPSQELSLQSDERDNDLTLSPMKPSGTLKKEQAEVFSSIMLDMYSMLVGLPDSYNMNQEKMLGISIHLMIALPRYYQEVYEEKDDIVEEVKTIEKNHAQLAREMDAFLERVELIIGRGIPYMERYALYQYILNMEVNE